ncbi:MAG: polysaccharide biosynthesis protein [Erysipelotrichaceae bacterium]|nr:polysaccharide biosynthesis protein [Erysipelotrichaceae bacterium]
MENNNAYHDINKRTKLTKYAYYYVVSDFLLSFAGVIVSFLAFYGYDGFGARLPLLLTYAGGLALLTVIACLIFKVYRIIINKNFGLSETLRIIVAVFIVNVIGFIVVATVPAFGYEYKEIHGPNYIWSWILYTSTNILFLCSTRFIWKAAEFNAVIQSKRKDGVRTLVVGAGVAGRVVLDETRKNKSNRNRVVAFIDDDPNKIGGIYANLPVKGPISDIGVVINYYQIEEVIIAINDIDETRLHEILALLDAYPVRVRRLPIISEMQGPNDVRIINVDLNDLLYRDPIQLDNGKVNTMLKGKTVMVTGAGGSIGSELVRQIFKARPRNLILFDIYENSTYDIQMELVRKMREKNITDLNLYTLIGSAYNATRVEQVIKKYRPDYIYHAAAYKHVPLMEDSPMEAIRTNVIGTYNVARLANKYRVKKMVLVSTDKAVRPTNTMGATKAFAEMIIRFFAKNSKTTKYAAVRFGNVLGSNGSVVPLFKKQIESGGPVTITDKNIIRYFMTIPEAVSLILQCGLFAEGGEIFILDMGKPVKILSLAERLIRQAGLVPYTDIKIIETGLRPGEKLYEELLLDPKTQTKTENKKIFIERKEKFNIPIEEDIILISKVFEMEDNDDIKKMLATVVKDYVITKNEHK